MAHVYVAQVCYTQLYFCYEVSSMVLICNTISGCMTYKPFLRFGIENTHICWWDIRAMVLHKFEQVDTL